MNPKFTHDCTACQFLGHYEGHDLYACDKKIEKTLIARFGDHGPEYCSGLTFGKNMPLRRKDGSINVMRVAWLLAKDDGIFDDDAEG